MSRTIQIKMKPGCELEPMTYDNWKTTNPDDQWLGPEPDVTEGLTDPEMKQIVDAVEKARARIEARPKIDADDLMFLQYCLALGMQDLLKREAIYANGGGWCLGRVHTDIARCHRLQDELPLLWDRYEV